MARRVRRNGLEVHLTPIEYRLLTVLMTHVGRVLTHRQLLCEVWGAVARRAKPLFAHLHGPPAAKAGARPGPAAASADRNRRRLPAGGAVERQILKFQAKKADCAQQTGTGSYELKSKQ